MILSATCSAVSGSKHTSSITSTSIRSHQQLPPPSKTASTTLYQFHPKPTKAPTTLLQLHHQHLIQRAVYTMNAKGLLQPPHRSRNITYLPPRPPPLPTANNSACSLLHIVVMMIMIMTLSTTMPDVALGVSYYFQEGRELFFIETSTGSRSQSSALSFCTAHSKNGTGYVLGLVRSSNQDRLLQEYLASKNINLCWSGARSSGLTITQNGAGVVTSRYYAPFKWILGYGGQTGPRSKYGTIIQTGGSTAGSEVSSIVYNSALSYSPSNEPLYAYWGRKLKSRTGSLSCSICVVSECNAEEDSAGFLFNNMTCGGRGVLTGYYPNCVCSCRRGWSGPLCTVTTATRSSLSLSLSLTQSALRTTSLSILTTTKTSSITNSLSSTLSLPITATLSMTATLTPSDSTSPTDSYSLTSSGGTSSSTDTMSLSDSNSISHTIGTSSSTTTMTLSPTTSLSASESITTSFSSSVSSSSSLTTSLSDSTTFSVSLSASTSTSTTSTISLSSSGVSSTYTESFSESMSSTSNCGILEYAFGGPGLCIILNTTGRNDGLECNASSTVRPVPTAIMINASSLEEVVPEAEFIPVAETAILRVDAYLWSTGAVIAAAVHIALPLKMRNHWGRALEAAAIGPDGLVEVTSFVNETSRRGVGRVLGSTTIRFYRYRGKELVPGGDGEWRTLPPGGAPATGAGRAEVAELLKGAPEGRLGMVVVYNGPRNSKVISPHDSEMLFELDEKVIECGERIDRLAFGVRLEGLVTFESAISDVSQQALDTLQMIGSVTAAFTLMPTVVLQLGVQNSIKEMSECRNFWVDVDEEGVGKYRLVDFVWLSGTKLQRLTSPYGLGIGSLGATHPTWVEKVHNSSSTPTEVNPIIKSARERAIHEMDTIGQYYRGAILTSIMNLAIFSVAVICAVFIVYIGRRYAGLLVPKATFKESILDAAAFVQVPSISLLGVSLLMDGLAEGSVTLISIRAKFSSESDGYASVFRTTALEAGISGHVMMSGVDGYLVAPGWTEASIRDMVLSAVSLSAVIIYIIHIAYVVTGKRLAVVLVPVEYELDTDDTSNNTTPTKNHTPHHDDDDDNSIGSVVSSHHANVPISLSTTPNSNHLRRSNEDDDDLSECRSLVLSPSTSPPLSYDLLSSDDDEHLAFSIPDTIDNTTTVSTSSSSTKSRWKLWRIEWFELQEHWVPPGDDSIGGPSYDAGVAWIRKYGMYVGGTTWAPYMVFELAIAFVVTGLEGYITSDPDKCAIKCTIALVLLGFQLTAVLLFKPLAAKFDLRITTVSLSLSLTVGVLITLNIILQNVYITILADIITVVASMVASLYGIVGGINSILSIIDVVGTVKKTFVTAQLRNLQEDGEDGINVDNNNNDDDGVVENEPVPPPPVLIVEEPNDDILLQDNRQNVNHHDSDNELEEMEPVLSEKETHMWGVYLSEMEEGVVRAPDGEDEDDDTTIALRDSILPKNREDDNTQTEAGNDENGVDPPTPNSATTRTILNADDDGADWGAFLDELEDNPHHNHHHMK